MQFVDHLPMNPMVSLGWVTSEDISTVQKGLVLSLAERVWRSPDTSQIVACMKKIGTLIPFERKSLDDCDETSKDLTDGLCVSAWNDLKCIVVCGTLLESNKDLAEAVCTPGMSLRKTVAEVGRNPDKFSVHLKTIFKRNSGSHLLYGKLVACLAVTCN